MAAAWSGTGGQKIRGYQSLATLMHQGHGYSPWIVADVAADMIAAEKKDPNIWDLYGKFSDKDGDGWFANDPVDGALEVMSRNSEGATGHLDPGTAVGKGRLDYLLGHGHGSRDWTSSTPHTRAPRPTTWDPMWRTVTPARASAMPWRPRRPVRRQAAITLSVSTPSRRPASCNTPSTH
ncbi:hypothetical protein ABT187_01640 [Streptomyces sp. NPDC001817]|uniref:hypothetical protein n=1 Tax=Streptomyces sp. NPDC001817 TaxID=3154398 RepID=UPI0033312AB7